MVHPPKHISVGPSSNVTAGEDDEDEDEEASFDSDASGAEDEDGLRADRQTGTRVFPLAKKRAFRYRIRGVNDSDLGEDEHATRSGSRVWLDEDKDQDIASD